MLLILAGVSISLVVGDNGVLTQAQNASKKTDVAGANTAIQLSLNSLSTEFMGETWSDNVNAKIWDTVTVSKLQKELDNNGFTLLSFQVGSETALTSSGFGNDTDSKKYIGTGKSTAVTGATPATTKIVIHEKGNAETKYTYTLVYNANGTSVGTTDITNADTN